MSRRKRPKTVRDRPGRPTAYRAEYARAAYHFCLLGATDAQLSEFFGVSESTLNLWKLKHPAFSESQKKAKLVADGQVAEMLFKKATGFHAPAIKIMQHEGAAYEHKYLEYHPPDTTAQIFWLKNRQGKLWRDRQDMTIGNPDGSNISAADIASAQLVAEFLYQKTQPPESKGKHAAK